MPHSPCMCEGTGNLPSERRDARVVEWTALEMRHTGDCIQGSNPCLSALSAQRLASCNPLCRFFLWSHVPSVTGFCAQWKFVGEGFFRKLRAVGDLLTAEAPHTPHLRREMIVQTGNFFSTGSSRPLSHQKKENRSSGRFGAITCLAQITRAARRKLRNPRLKYGMSFPIRFLCPNF